MRAGNSERDTSSVTKLREDGATLGRFGAGLTYDTGFMQMDRVLSPQSPFTSMKCATENQDGGSPEKPSREEVLINRLGMLLWRGRDFSLQKHRPHHCQLQYHGKVLCSQCPTSRVQILPLLITGKVPASSTRTKCAGNPCKCIEPAHGNCISFCCYEVLPILI